MFSLNNLRHICYEDLLVNYEFPLNFSSSSSVLSSPNVNPSIPIDKPSFPDTTSTFQKPTASNPQPVSNTRVVPHKPKNTHNMTTQNSEVLQLIPQQLDQVGVNSNPHNTISQPKTAPGLPINAQRPTTCNTQYTKTIPSSTVINQNIRAPNFQQMNTIQYPNNRNIQNVAVQQNSMVQQGFNQNVHQNTAHYQPTQNIHSIPTPNVLNTRPQVLVAPQIIQQIPNTAQNLNQTCQPSQISNPHFQNVPYNASPVNNNPTHSNLRQFFKQPITYPNIQSNSNIQSSSNPSPSFSRFNEPVNKLQTTGKL